MGRWRAAAPLLFNHLTKTPFPSHKFLTHSLPLKGRPKPLCLPPSLNPPLRFLFTRPFSGIPSQVPVYTSDSEDGSPDFYHQNHVFVSQEEEEEETGKIPIKAYFRCTSIDLKSMQAENLSNIVPPSSRSSNYIGLRYCDFPTDITGRCQRLTNDKEALFSLVIAIGMKDKVSSCRYMVVFQYGSAVLFNIQDHEIESYLEIVRIHASELLPEMRRDDYAVKEQPWLAKDMQGGPDFVVLQTLDTDTIRIIGPQEYS
ncbi:hypothetical protein POUND7_014742 [Theobroma cacao]